MLFFFLKLDDDFARAQYIDTTWAGIYNNIYVKFTQNIIYIITLYIRCYWSCAV